MPGPFNYSWELTWASPRRPGPWKLTSKLYGPKPNRKMGTQRTVNTHNMINACKLAGIWLFMERGFTTCAHAQSMLLECFKSRARSNRGDQIRIAHIVRCPSPSRLSIKYTEASPVHRWRPAPPPPPLLLLHRGPSAADSRHSPGCWIQHPPRRI